jgi:multiple sugar transport system permease protein
MAISTPKPIYAPATMPLGARLRLWWQREETLAYAFIAPALFVLLMLVAYPFVIALYLSVTDAFVGQPTTFVGLRNFIRLLQHGTFRQTLGNSFLFTGTAVALKVVIGLALALALHQKLRFQKFWRGAILLPWVVPSALATLGWTWMFDSLYSVINWTLVQLGLVEVGPNWLGDVVLAKCAVIAVNVWRGLPFFAISILAGLVSIPQDLYEAAAADGAGPVQRFFYVTLPLLKPVLAIVLLFSTIFTFSNFDIVYVLTRGGPVNSTHLFATLARQVGLESGLLGEGAAISLYMFPVLVIVVFFQLRFVRREEY